MHSISNFARNFAQRKNAQHSKFRNEFRETLALPNFALGGSGQGPQGSKVKFDTEFSWSDHVARLSDRDFKLRYGYRLTLPAFNELLEMLRPHLKVQDIMAAVLSERAVGTIFSPVQGAPTLGAGRKAGARPGELAPAFSPPRKRWPVASGRCWACGPAVHIDTTAFVLAAALLRPAAHSPSALGSRSARLQDTSPHSHAILACDTTHDALLLCELHGTSTRVCSDQSSGYLVIIRSQGMLLALARLELCTRAFPRARLLANRGAYKRLRNRSRSRPQARVRGHRERARQASRPRQGHLAQEAPDRVAPAPKEERGGCRLNAPPCLLLPSGPARPPPPLPPSMLLSSALATRMINSISWII